MRLGPSLLGAIIGALVGVAAQIGLERGLGIEAPWFAIVTGLITGIGARAMAGEFIKQASYLRGALAGLIALGAIVGGSAVASALIRAQNLKGFESSPLPKITITEDTDEEPTTDEAGAPANDSDNDNNGEAAAGGSNDSETTKAPAEVVAGEGAGEDMTAEVGAAESDPAAGRNDEAGSDEPDEKVASESEIEIITFNEPAHEKPSKQPLSPLQFVFIAVGAFVAYELARGGGAEKAATTTTEA